MAALLASGCLLWPATRMRMKAAVGQVQRPGHRSLDHETPTEQTPPQKFGSGWTLQHRSFVYGGVVCGDSWAAAELLLVFENLPVKKPGMNCARG